MALKKPLAEIFPNAEAAAAAAAAATASGAAVDHAAASGAATASAGATDHASADAVPAADAVVPAASAAAPALAAASGAAPAPAPADPARLDLARIPAHVAVIMDGNGRWAKKRALNRLRGHKAGIEAVRETIRCANDLGVRYLTIYSFSTENWTRPKDEVDGLMDLFARTMLAEVESLHAEGVRVKTIGDTTVLPPGTRRAFEDAWELTRQNEGMTLVVAINYGGRNDILHALNSLIEQGAKTPIGEGEFEAHLYTAGIPDPELVIRTSGELRISNFLLWQTAYSEFVSTDVLWPDFNRYDFLNCLLQYQSRDRRFGGVTEK